MEELLEQLKQARQAVDIAQQQVETMQYKLFLTLEFADLKDAKGYLEEKKHELELIDEQVRQEALDLYGLTGNKHPFEKVSIVINRTLHYQESEAFDWAGRNAPTMLKLDTKKFEKHARAVLETIPLAFVEVEEVPSVRIAGEL